MAKRKREEDIDVKGVEADGQEPAVKKLKLDPLKLLHEKVFDNSYLPGAIDGFLGGADKAKLAVTEKKRAKWLKDRPERLEEYYCVKCKLLFSYKLSLSDYDADGKEYENMIQEEDDDGEPIENREHFCDDCMPERCDTCKDWLTNSELEHCDERDGDFCKDCIKMDCDNCGSSYHPDDLDEKDRCPDCHEDCARCGDAYADESFHGRVYCEKCFQIKSVEYCRDNCR
jgi:hypothetical protein